MRKSWRNFYRGVKALCGGRIGEGRHSCIDGTKMNAHAALSSNRTQKHIEEEVEKMLEEAASKDAEEDRKFGKDKRGDELPEELRVGRAD